ncbi:hypothetical protein EVAR_63031_1 [Eumeta japonica]|uniref:Uncharacterized protein n=1 Tax=Eumeta variegata TaxID=151549 RepID=A0A4C1Z4H1_EUMVA|nr:hypothetical protein EVAR_63031_1 [Eumeta japonica]
MVTGARAWSDYVTSTAIVSGLLHFPRKEPSTSSRGALTAHGVTAARYVLLFTINSDIKETFLNHMFMMPKEGSGEQLRGRMRLCGVVRRRGMAHDGIESVVVVGGVLHLADGAIGLQQRVLAVHDVAVAGLLLRLIVAGVAVGDGVREVIFGIMKDNTYVFFFVMCGDHVFGSRCQDLGYRRVVGDGCGGGMDSEGQQHSRAGWSWRTILRRDCGRGRVMRHGQQPARTPTPPPARTTPGTRLAIYYNDF